ncbi:hypothetical protein C2845_PM14G09790 [Panicum miliaceum]|uniref:Uncharacterized protein n=1 Tax=Panicum miliaceum TaxID=4540 RepID=A0A3L6PU31_PANMI|nr:hypothetical protein C2845_PM14G09790 [Panicum miliaceum]
MVSKKSATKGKRKGKGKGSKLAASSGDGWRKSKCSKAVLQSLVDKDLLQSKEIIQWRAATSDAIPYEHAKEIVLFLNTLSSADWDSDL